AATRHRRGRVPRRRRRSECARGVGAAGDACCLEPFVRLLPKGTIAAAALPRQLSGHVIAQPAQRAGTGVTSCPQSGLGAGGWGWGSLLPLPSPPFLSTTTTASPRPS